MLLIYLLCVCVCLRYWGLNSGPHLGKHFSNPSFLLLRNITPNISTLKQQAFVISLFPRIRNLGIPWLGISASGSLVSFLQGCHWGAIIWSGASASKFIDIANTTPLLPQWQLVGGFSFFNTRASPWRCLWHGRLAAFCVKDLRHVAPVAQSVSARYLYKDLRLTD
jgi:hypothetical protein